MDGDSESFLATVMGEWETSLEAFGQDFDVDAFCESLGIPPTDPLTLARAVPKDQRPFCGARTRAGGSCKARAVPGCRRCRMHGAGGGPKTLAGRRRIGEATRQRAAARHADPEESVTTADSLQEMERELLLSIQRQVADFERQNGPLTPAPSWASLPERHSKRQAMCVFKRELLRLGEYAPPVENRSQDRTES